MNLFGKSISVLEGGLNYSAAKGKVISQNIANIDTPNYKAKNVSFKEVFSAVKANELPAYKTDARHIDFQTRGTEPGIFSYSNLNFRHNGNGIDMDKQQADLAANQIYYNAVVDRLNGKFNSLQNVIKGGR